MTPQVGSGSSFNNGAANSTQSFVVRAVPGTTGPEHVIEAHFHYNGLVPDATQIPTWKGSFTHNGAVTNYTMVGKNPGFSNVTTTIPTVIIPIKIVVGNPQTTFGPGVKASNGKTVVQNTVASPMFQNGVTFKAGTVSLGDTQYVDAFQRGNFWNHVKTNTAYHTLLGQPTIEPVQTISTTNLSEGNVGTAFGQKVGLMDINFFDPKIEAMLTKLNIPPTTEAIFLTGNVYLTQGAANLNDCCIGGYHNFNGTQTYMHATYITKVGAFAQDVSALSHEVSEFYDDPFVNTPGCGGLLEVGDPLESEANFGGFQYTLNGFTYNLQDEVFLPYFGAARTTSVNSWFSLHNAALSVCSNSQ